MADVELSEVASILTGNAPEPDESQEAPDTDQIDESLSASEEPEQAEPEVEIPTKLTVKDIAEKLELTPEQVYETLNLKIGDEEISLGSLKDGVQDLNRANELRESAESHKTESENDILRQRRELAVAQQRVQPTEQEKRIAEQNWSDYVAKENAATLEAIPDWKDTVKQTEGLQEVNKLLKEYAYSSAEIQTLVDHRMLKLFNDHATLRNRLNAAKVAVKDTKQQRSGNRRRSPATGTKRAVELHKAGKINTTSAVAAILADGQRK